MIKLAKPIVLSVTITDIATEVLGVDINAETAQIRVSLISDTGSIVATKDGTVRNGKSDRISIVQITPDQTFADALVWEPGVLATPTAYADILTALGSTSVKGDRKAAVSAAAVASVISTEDQPKEAAQDVKAIAAVNSQAIEVAQKK